MPILGTADKKQIIERINALEEALGPAPLKNIDPILLDPREIDVVAVGSIVFRDDNTTVLVRRAETPNEWIIPGGTVDPGEDVVETVIREVREETGLDIEIDALLRVGLARNYGPPAFRKVNRERFGKESISLLFLNFRSHELGGELDCSGDPSQNIIEVRAFREVPFGQITHVYKVLFVQQQLYQADIKNYPAVEFDSPSAF